MAEKRKRQKELAVNVSPSKPRTKANSTAESAKKTTVQSKGFKTTIKPLTGKAP